MTEPHAPSFESLLRHEPFVRAVARGLLSDEDRVQDVVQETWLRALRRPPRGGGSLRAWLARVARNLALDARRSEHRRANRERAAARPEADESVEATRARLAVQREVVDAVLALDEPYRSVVLLRYHHGLDAEEIGRRLGRSAATVRSQLARARERLRARLDDRVDGGRGAWAVALLPSATEATTRWWTSAVAQVAAGVAVVGTSVVLAVRAAGPGEEAAVAALRPPESAAPVAAASGAPIVSRPASEPTPNRASLAPARAQRQEPPTDEDLASHSLRELLELAVQTQRAVQSIALTPDPAVAEEHAALLALPGTGICRLVEQRRGDAGLDHALAVRGGGSYFSFATEEHSYDSEPDLSYGDGRFRAGFYGLQLGMLLSLGDLPLAELPRAPVPVPHTVPEERLGDWDALWSDLTLDDAAHRSNFRERVRGLGRAEFEGMGASYLLRVFSPDEHDHLVAFRVVGADELGVTLVWRVLRTWPVPGPRRSGSAPVDRFASVPEGPRMLEVLETAELLDLLQRVRDEAQGRLLDVPEELRARYAHVAASADPTRAGFARILHRGEWDPLVRMRGGGAYWSFLERSNSYDERPELQLEQDRYSSGFAGGQRGMILDLGPVPEERLGAVLSGSPPADLEGRRLDAWNFLHDVRASVRSGRRDLSPSDAEHAAELGFDRRGVPARVGHTYLLRAVTYSDHDHLVAFTVIGEDEAGHSLVWRILRSWPVEQPPRNR